MKKNKHKKANEKKSIGSKKRKASEREKFFDNPANNTRFNPKTGSGKGTFSNSSEKNSFIGTPGRSDSRIKQAQSFLKKLLNQNTKTIITKKAKIKETLNDILSEVLTVDQLKTSRLGQDLQQFANMCNKATVLSEFQKPTQTVLNKLKEDVILSLFGAEETNNQDEKMEESLPKEEKKIQTNEQSSKEPVEEFKKEEAKPEEEYISNANTPEKKSESSETSSANAKEPAIMLIVCKEIAELLKKVIIV